MNKARKLVKYLHSYLATPLPVTMAEYETWVESIIELAGPVADNRSMRWAISNMVPHIPPTASSYPKRFFVKCLRKGATNQIVFGAIQNIKAEQEKEKAAATAQQEAVANENANKETPQ